jgi:hypothetical protein
VWSAATVATYGSILALIYVKHSVLPDANHQPLWWEIAHALAFVSYSAAQTFNILALFLRFSNDGSSIFDPFRDSAYGIYLIHYLPVLWQQYVLYDFSFSIHDAAERHYGDQPRRCGRFPARRRCFSRHCERSEANHPSAKGAAKWIASSLHSSQ